MYGEGQCLAPGASFICRRRDVAIFMLDTAESGDFKRKCMAITSG